MRNIEEKIVNSKKKITDPVAYYCKKIAHIQREGILEPEQILQTLLSKYLKTHKDDYVTNVIASNGFRKENNYIYHVLFYLKKCNEIRPKLLGSPLAKLLGAFFSIFHIYQFKISPDLQEKLGVKNCYQLNVAKHFDDITTCLKGGHWTSRPFFNPISPDQNAIVRGCNLLENAGDFVQFISSNKLLELLNLLLEIIKNKTVKIQVHREDPVRTLINLKQYIPSTILKTIADHIINSLKNLQQLEAHDYQMFKVFSYTIEKEKRRAVAATLHAFVMDESLKLTKKIAVIKLLLKFFDELTPDEKIAIFNSVSFNNNPKLYLQIRSKLEGVEIEKNEYLENNLQDIEFIKRYNLEGIFPLFNEDEKKIIVKKVLSLKWSKQLNFIFPHLSDELKQDVITYSSSFFNQISSDKLEKNKLISAAGPFYLYLHDDKKQLLLDHIKYLLSEEKFRQRAYWMLKDINAQLPEDFYTHVLAELDRHVCLAKEMHNCDVQSVLDLVSKLIEHLSPLQVITATKLVMKILLTINHCYGILKPLKTILVKLPYECKIALFNSVLNLNEELPVSIKMQLYMACDSHISYEALKFIQVDIDSPQLQSVMGGTLDLPSEVVENIYFFHPGKKFLFNNSQTLTNDENVVSPKPF